MERPTAVNLTAPGGDAAAVAHLAEARVKLRAEIAQLVVGQDTVVATQNPVEQEGTYPLPEAQLDRFMFNVPVTYPTPDEEVAIVKSTTTNEVVDVKPVLTAAEVLRLQELVRGVPVADAVVRYAV